MERQSPATSDDAEALAAGLAVVLARARCQAIHRQINGGRCLNCISWAESIGVPEHLPRMRLAVARRPSPDAGAEVTTAQARAYDDGYNDAATMARCYGHTDHWPDEDEPRNPYRVESAAAPREAETCGDFPPGMHPNLRGTVGAWYHACHKPRGHDGPHHDGKGTTWGFTVAEPTRDDGQHAATVCEHGFRPEPGRCPAGCTVATHTRDDGQPAPVLTDDEREVLRQKFDAYYYGFERTGCEPIDNLLSALAYAGKAFHHTADWQDEIGVQYGPIREDETPADMLQRVASDSAARVAAAVDRAALDRVRAEAWDEGYRAGGEHQFESARYRASLNFGPEVEPPAPAVNPYREQAGGEQP